MSSTTTWTAAEKKMNRLIVLVSILVPALVTFLFFSPFGTLQLEVSFLPKLNAMINSAVSVLLIAGYFFIRSGKIKLHRASMLTAFMLSAIFLVSYVIYHGASESTHFEGTGLIKVIYLSILITHIILAALILPLILFTIYRALSGRLEQHRKLARWTFPLWLYVSVSGVVVYLMISPYY